MSETIPVSDHPVKLPQTDRSQSVGFNIQAPTIEHNQSIGGTIRDWTRTGAAANQSVGEWSQTCDMRADFRSKSVGMQFGAGLISPTEVSCDAKEWGQATGQR